MNKGAHFYCGKERHGEGHFVLQAGYSVERAGQGVEKSRPTDTGRRLGREPPGTGGAMSFLRPPPSLVQCCCSAVSACPEFLLLRLPHRFCLIRILQEMTMGCMPLPKNVELWSTPPRVALHLERRDWMGRFQQHQHYSNYHPARKSVIDCSIVIDTLR